MTEEQNNDIFDELDDIDVNEYADNTTTMETWKADKIIKKVKRNNRQLDKYKEIKDQRVKEIENQYQEKKKALDKENMILLSTLNQFAKNQDDLKDSQTQKKYESLEGNIVIKKSKSNVTKPSEDDIEKVKAAYPSYFEKVHSDKLDWQNLKSRFIVSNGKVIDQDTGEDVSHLFKIETKEEETTIK